MNGAGPDERPVDLSQVPGSMTPAQPASAPPPPPPSPPPGAAPGSSTTAAGFDFNQPTILSLLYISAFLLGITGLVAVVLAYVWKDQPHAEWEVSHYRYHIRTFWLWLIGGVIGVVLTIFLVGLFVLLAVAVLVVVRSVLSLIKAQAHEPMPNPDTWLA
jgi:uncharacterized membrane protein